MWRGPDLAVIGLNLAVMVWIGVYCARKSKSSDAYFLAGRNMAGWVVGMSMMATIVSSMTFLATPGFTYSENWRYMPANFTYLLAAIPGLLLFMPLFRRGGFRSAYEYLETAFRRLGAALCRRGLHPVPDVPAGRDPLRGLPAHQGHDRVPAALGDRDLRRPGGRLHHCRRPGGSHLDRPDPGVSP